tara:strand:- start:3682 stop:4122 length:441 start_codon:yes stop_codon:yes gene_type:complete
MMRQVLCAAAIYALSTPVFAEGQAITYDYDGSFEDATFAVENAIIGKGLVVDYVSHTGEMLNRTGPDVGSDIEIFKAADVYLFCSAVVSRRVMEADPMNIVHCPYSIFVADIEGKVTVGYPTFPDGPMQEVQALLDEITKSALDGF